MKRIPRRTLVLAGLLTLVVATGCTRSLELSYTADTARLANADARARISLGVARFEDVDRLMNGVFKKVALQVIEQVATKLALRPEDVRIRVAHGARAWEISGALN